MTPPTPTIEEMLLAIFTTNIEHDGSYIPVSAIKKKIPEAALLITKARIDERENMKFIYADGVETHAPFVMYRYTCDGLLLDWEGRTKQLESDLKATTQKEEL